MPPDERTAARERVAVLYDMLRINGPIKPGTADFNQMLLELNELHWKLGEFPRAEAEQNQASLREEIAEIEAAELQSMELARRPTEAEIVMSDLPDRLATRQGTFIPDFRSLFEKKAELDRKFLEP